MEGKLHKILGSFLKSVVRVFSIVVQSSLVALWLCTDALDERAAQSSGLKHQVAM
jgi:hypothetical protein